MKTKAVVLAAIGALLVLICKRAELGCGLVAAGGLLDRLGGSMIPEHDDDELAQMIKGQFLKDEAHWGAMYGQPTYTNYQKGRMP